VSPEDLPDWERLLAAERHLQALVPCTVLVGGGTVDWSRPTPADPGIA
jgi:hypothetical protein